jgi:DNA-directed RNA polymerase subunit E'/Rpb7
MKNTGQIVRSKKTGKSRYTPISNEIIQSKTLTIEERGVLIYLLSLPEDWVIYKKYIWKDINIGRDKFNRIWTNLVKYGYIVSIKVIDTNSNLIIGYNHVVYEEPILPNIGVTENQDYREPVPIQSTNLQSNNLQNNKIENNISTNIEHLGKSLPVEKLWLRK